MWGMVWIRVRVEGGVGGWGWGDRLHVVALLAGERVIADFAVDAGLEVEIFSQNDMIADDAGVDVGVGCRYGAAGGVR